LYKRNRDKAQFDFALGHARDRASVSILSPHIEELPVPSIIINIASFAARLLLALIFIVAGWGKLQDPAGIVGYMGTVGLPAFLV